MIAFAWPLLFILLPLPYLLFKCLPRTDFNERAALNVPELDDFLGLKNHSSGSISKTKLLLASLIWLALLSAAARPQWIGNPIEIPQSGRDLMLAIDLSGSMQIKDFELKGQLIDRLTASKLVASDFIERRKGDRIGLILFGSQAYLQTPLTFDTATVKQLLMETEVGLAGNETALGDAIGIALKQMSHSPEASRVLILLTDGISNAGELSTEKAAEIASHTRLKIHTIGIGADSMLVQTLFGPRQVNQPSSIDEKALKGIAEKTGGRYFRAHNTKELIQIYEEIDQLEKIEQKPQIYRPRDEIYFWPLLAALFLFGLLMGYESLTRVRA